MEFGKPAFDLASKAIANRFAFDQSNGLTISFKSGKVKMYGGVFEFPGGNITVPDNSTRHIMIDLQDKSLHAFTRAIHRGGIFIATVTTSGGKVTSVKQTSECVVPQTRISRFKSKLLRDKQLVRVSLQGDSLTEGAGGTPRWTSLLFDPAYVANGYNLSRLTDFEYVNYAVGGQTSHHGLVQIGRAVKSSVSKITNTVITYPPYYDSRYVSSVSKITESKLLTGNPDLVFVEFGANGGTYNVGFVENIVRRLRKRGIDVCILTSNPHSDDGTFLVAEGTIMSQIADAYGCELIDTWAYVREAMDKGVTVHADIIHMNSAGHLCWTKAIRSVLNDVVQEAAMLPPVENMGRFITYTGGTANEPKKFPSVAEVQFEPIETTGAANTSGTLGGPTKCPAINYGGRSSYITRLTAGQVAWFAHAHAHAVDILIEQMTAFTADILVSSSTLTPTRYTTIASTQSGQTRVALIEGVPMGVYGDLSTTSPGYKNGAVQVKCLTGTMDVVGAVFYTWDNQEVKFKDIDFIGTWLDGTSWNYGHNFTKYTNTDAAYFIYEFEGNGIQLLFGKLASSGKIDVWFDGVQTHTQYDLYNGSGTNLVQSIDLFPENGSGIGNYNRGYGKHIVKVALNGLNASATAGNRLELLAGYVFDSR